MSKDEQRRSKLLGDVAEDHLVLDELRSHKKKAAHLQGQPPWTSQTKKTNTVDQLWERGGGAIPEEAVTSALNAHSWQFGRINEEMTPKQYLLVCCNSQQGEEGDKWDRHSSSDLHDQQMDGQDQWKEDI